MPSLSLKTDVLLFAATAALVTAFFVKRAAASKTTSETSTCSLRNSAFVFIKPHANTKSVQTLVKETLLKNKITILSEQSISGDVIDKEQLIDQHYYAIASKATILPAKDIPVPTDKFESFFGESWETVLSEHRAVNALQACQEFNCTANQLDAAWGSAKVTKFGGGFYCGLVSLNNKSLYVFNAFFMNMRSKFVGSDVSIYCFVVVWDANTLSWDDFRNKVLGPTDPAQAPIGSLRRTILDDYQTLGLTGKPNKGDNGVHASASPFEGLAEKMNWLKASIHSDPFGKALLDSGIPKHTLLEWSVDPRVRLPNGETGSIFDALEDMNVDECLATLKLLYTLNGDGA